MNLMKSFNLNYLIQNLKKSRTLLLITILIVPILTIFLMINNDDIESSIFSSNIINIIGMYIIPIVISKILFGYVFKKKSVDFIGSMPLNRKTIYITNFIGGFIIILLIQFLTIASIGITSIFLENSIININMLLDFFFIGVISYMFVFTSTNLAMSISGNLLTQIAVTLLILFLIPFTIDALNGFNFQNSIEFKKDKIDNITFSVQSEKNYTLPYNLIKSMLLGTYLLENETLIKMGFLIIVYYIIGQILFKNRKMENNEESFSNIYMHLFIKGLTLIPIIAITVFSTSKIKVILFIIAIIFAYYYIYDILTKRKVEFKIQIIGFIVSIGLLFGIFTFSKENVKSKVQIYSKNDIESISIMKNRNFFKSRDVKDLKQMNYEFKNPEIIDEFYEGMNRKYSVEKIMFCYSKIKLKNGKEFYDEIPLKISNYNKIKEMVDNDDGYRKTIKEDLKIENNDKYNIFIQNIKIKDKQKEVLVNLINDGIDKYIDKNVKLKNSSDLVNCYYYSNHKLHCVNIPIDLTLELKKYVIELTNKITIESLNRIDFEDKNIGYISCNVRQNEGENVYNDVFDENAKLIIDIVKKSNFEVDINKPINTILIYISGMNGINMKFYTNNLEKINKLPYDKYIVNTVEGLR